MRYAVIAVLCAGCLGEANVIYQGTVTEGPSSGYSFDATPNPRAARPIAGATVEVCIDRCPGRSVTTGSDGAFGQIERVFGGFIGKDTLVIVRATAPDGRRVSYETIYESTSDPTDGVHFLNLQIGP